MQKYRAWRASILTRLRILRDSDLMPTRGSRTRLQWANDFRERRAEYFRPVRALAIIGASGRELGKLTYPEAITLADAIEIFSVFGSRFQRIELAADGSGSGRAFVSLSRIPLGLI